MGLFQNKQKSGKNASDDNDVAHFFDENFREELRNHGRWYFEKVIKENGELFKQDLDATIENLNAEIKEHTTSQLDGAITSVTTELKEHVTKQLDEQFADYTQAVKHTQDVALQSIVRSSEVLREQYQALDEALRKKVGDQEAMLTTAFEENKAQISAMKEAQASALEWLNQSLQVLHEQHEQLTNALQQKVAAQEAMLVDVFQKNMAQIVEHHLKNALADQYDIDKQLPAIIKEMEANKQAIVDDMKL